MSMMIGRNNSNVRRIELKKPDGSSAGSISYTLPSKKKEKRLQYNFKEISNQILRTKTSGSASQVVAKARRKVAMLQRNNISNSDYDQTELRHAILHAQRIERAARKRMKHLKQEEAIQQKQNSYVPGMEEEMENTGWEPINPEEILKLSEEEMRQLMEEMQEMLQETMDQLEIENAERDLENNDSEYVLDNLEAMDLERLKKKHRSEELRDIMEADMKYLKAMFEKLAQEKQNASRGGSSYSSANSGVSLELGGVEMPVEAPVEVPVPVEGGNLDMTV